MHDTPHPHGGLKDLPEPQEEKKEALLTTKQSQKTRGSEHDSPGQIPGRRNLSQITGGGPPEAAAGSRRLLRRTDDPGIPLESVGGMSKTGTVVAGAQY